MPYQVSDPVRVALVAEGPTDLVVVEAILRSVLEDREFVIKQLQPESSVAFGPLGGGWSGVYYWCRQSAKRGGGRLGGDESWSIGHDLLILHCDADVAGQDYESAGIQPAACDEALPCEKPCPPAYATIAVLRNVVLSWGGETTIPPRIVLCIPSKATEAWVVTALCPTDQEVQKGTAFECHSNPENRLGQQPTAKRFRKRTADYRQRLHVLAKAWPKVASVLGEAKRFQSELIAALPS